jgi:hypothetical protein
MCPFCNLLGTLIRYGSIRGYTDEDSHLKTRGKRIFCNSRRTCKPKGCGRSFSLLDSALIRGLQLRTMTLWSFFVNIINDLNIRKSASKIKSTVSLKRWYRIWKRFVGTQPQIRTLLLSLVKAPQCNSECPLVQTILHLKAAFDEKTCVLSGFQMRFQVSIL